MGIQLSTQSVIYMLRSATLLHATHPVLEFHITKAQATVVSLDVSPVLINLTLLDLCLLLHHIRSGPFKTEPRSNLSTQDQLSDGAARTGVCL